MVVGSDLNAGMVAFAREVSVSEWPGIAWEEASALDLPYDSGGFDRVICQQGLQFFPDPSAGLAEMGRVTRAGGTVAVTVWSELSTSPYFEALVDVLADYGHVEPSELLFTATPTQVVEWFTAAGLADPKVDLVSRTVDLPPIAEYLPAHMKALPWAANYFELDQQSQDAAVKYVEQRLREYATPVGPSTPFGSYLAQATLQ